MPVTREKRGELFITLEVVDRTIGDFVATAAAAVAAPTELTVTERLMMSDLFMHYPTSEFTDLLFTINASNHKVCSSTLRRVLIKISNFCQNSEVELAPLQVFPDRGNVIESPVLCEWWQPRTTFSPRGRKKLPSH